MTCCVDPSIDNSRQQGSRWQPCPGRHHLSHRWLQHWGDDAPGGPEQNQVCYSQTDTQHAEVSKQHSHTQTTAQSLIKRSKNFGNIVHTHINAPKCKQCSLLYRSRRPAPVPTATPRMDSPMPIIPHQKVGNAPSGSVLLPPSVTYTQWITGYGDETSCSLGSLSIFTHLRSKKR